MSKARQQANLSSDGNLFADISNDRVGVGSVVPTHKLHVNGTSKFDDDVKFEGTTAANNVLWDKSANALDFLDDTKAIFGTGEDLKIYHNSSNNHSYISETGSGSLIVLADDFYIQDTSTNSMIQCIEGAQVQLHYAGNKKLETTNTGAKVTGNLEVTGVLTYDDVTSIDSVGIITARDHIKIKADNKSLYLGASDDFQLFHNGSHNIIKSINGNLYLQDADYIEIGDPSGKVSIGCVPGGVTNLRHNGSSKLETTTRGIKLQSGLTSGNGISNMLQLDNDGNSNSDGSKITFSRAGTIRTEIEALKNETSNNETDIVFRTTLAGSIGEKLRIDSSGRHLIGNSTSRFYAAKLQVQGASDSNYILMHNTSAGDADGNRYSKLVYSGTQSGGETSDLAHINAAHDGTADDQKGRIEFRTNAGSGNHSPTEALRIDSSGNICGASGIINLKNPSGSGDVFVNMLGTSGDARLDLESTGNGNYSGIDFVRQRASGAGVVGGAIFMKSDTSNNLAHLYIQAQSASAQSPVTSALAANNGVRLLLEGGSGRFGVSTGDTETFVITSAGKIGVGVAAPDEKLDVRDGDIILSSSNAGSAHRTSFIEFTGSYARINSVANQGSTGSSNYAAGWNFTTRNYTGSAFETLTPFVIQANGRIGINETSPGTHLHVEQDNAHSSTYYLNSDAAILIQNKNSTSTSKTVLKLEGPNSSPSDCAIVYGAGSSTLIFADRQNERVRINASGNVSIASNNYASGHSSAKLRVGQESGSTQGTVVIGSADTAVPALTLTNWDGSQTSNWSVIQFDNSGWGNFQVGCTAGADAFSIYDDTVSRVHIDSAGKIGISETSPGYPVDIAYTNNSAYSTTACIGNAIEIHNKSTTAGTSAGVHMYVTGNGANAAAVHLNAVHTANGTGDFTLGTRHSAGQHIERVRVTSIGKVSICDTGAGAVGDPFTGVHLKTTGYDIASGNAIKNSTMGGITVQMASNDDKSIGLWFGTNNSHWSGISGQRNNSASTWGTDLRFYTHENATSDLTYSRERMKIGSEGELWVPNHTFRVNRGTSNAAGAVLYFSGSKSTTNAAFDMFKIYSVHGNTTLKIEMAFHHSGGGVHGSYTRRYYTMNSYDSLNGRGTFQDSNFGGGGGFTLSRASSPNNTYVTVRYNGSSSFHQNFICTGRIEHGQNGTANDLYLVKESLDGLSYSINY